MLSGEASSAGTKAGGALAGGMSKAIGAAKIGVAAVAATGAAVTAATGALVSGAAGVAEYGDNIDKMSQKMGISATAYQEWDAIMQHSGTSIEALKPSMKTLATQAEKGSDAFEKLGISEEEVASLSQEDLFAKVITGLQGMEEGTERTYITSQLLGRGATELGALLNTSAQETEAMRQKVHELGGVMSDDAVKSAAKFQDTLQDMTTGFDSLKRNMMSEFLPSITTVMEGMTDIFTGDSDKGLATLETGITGFVDKLTTIAPKALEVAGRIVAALGEGLIQNLPALTSSVLNVAKELGTMLVQNLPGLISQMMQDGFDLILDLAEGMRDPAAIQSVIDAVFEIVDSIAMWIGEYAYVLIDAAVGIITTLVETLTDPGNITRFVETALFLIQSLANGLIEALPELAASIPVIITNLINAFTENIGPIIQTGVEIIVALINGLVEATPQLVAKMPEIITALFNALIVAIPQLLQAGVQIIAALIKGVVQMVPQLIAEAPKLIKSFIDGIKNLFSALKETGAQIIENIKGAISEKIQQAAEWGKDLIGNFIGGIKSRLGDLKNSVSNAAGIVKSYLGFSEPDEGPLSNFHTYAPDMIDLFAKGIYQSASTLQTAVGALAGDVRSAMPMMNAIQNNGSYSAAVAGGYGDLTVPVYIGQQRFATAVVKADQINNYRNGGR